MIRVEYRAARLGGCWLVMSSDLQTLIDAHRAANKNFEAHLDQLANAEDAHEFIHRNELYLAPNLLNGGGYEIGKFDCDECREMVSRDYDAQCHRLSTLARVAPDIAEQSRAALDAAKAKNMALIDKAFKEEEARKEASGLAQVQRDCDRANDAEDAAAMALCSYLCKTNEEARIRAQYILETPIIRDRFMQGEYVRAFLRSCVGDAAVVERGTHRFQAGSGGR